MSKVNYYLKNSPSEKTLELLKKENRKNYNAELDLRRPIIMSVAHHGTRELFSTGKFIPLRFWDKKKMVVKKLLDTPDTAYTDAKWLEAKKTEVETLLQNAVSEHRAITKDELYELILSEVRTQKATNSLKDVLLEFFAEHKTKKGASIKKIL